MDIQTLFNTKQKILENKLSILLDHQVTKGENYIKLIDNIDLGCAIKNIRFY